MGSREFSPGEVEIFGYRISCRGLNDDILLARSLITSRSKGRYLACANSHSLVVASRDQAFSKALRQSDMLIPDGEGILLAARMLNLPVKERVTGSDFFQGLTGALSKEGGARYFFLGSTDRVLTLITARIREEFPNIKVCGTLSPPFKAVFTEYENRQMAATINKAQPDILWVGMTAPKQEKWIYENRDKLQVPFIAAIGAVFDFYAGTKQRPAIFWQKLGLEWLPRFLREPRRLWERNLRSTPIFLYWIVREMIRKAQ